MAANSNFRSHTIAERLLKVRDFLYANATPTHAVTAEQIQRYLSDENFDVKIKTIYSDLQTLEAEFGLDLAYNARQRGYILKNPPFSPYELRMMVNSIQSAKFMTQEEADALTLKVMKIADKHTRPSLDRHAYVHNRVRNTNAQAMAGLDTIYEAIEQDKKISFKYFKYSPDAENRKIYHVEAGSKIITVSPYYVLWDGDRHILNAYTESRGTPANTTIAVERMEDIRILPDDRDGAELYEDESFRYIPFASALSEVATVTLKVKNDHATYIVEKFGENVTMKPYDSDHFTVDVEVGLSPLFFSWVAIFFEGIQVIAPQKAVVFMCALIMNLSYTYLDSKKMRMLQKAIKNLGKMP